MPNKSGNAYGLTTFCPIRNGYQGNQSYAAEIRNRLEDLGLNENSPMASVPNTYLCRFYVLDNVFYEGKPADLEELRSKYLVFTSNFHGDLEPYLQGMWNTASDQIRPIWEFCVGFDKVHDANSFVAYIKRCQVNTTFFFNGSTDDPLDEQLKSLYLKQELTKFVYEHQGQSAEELQQAFKEFVARTRPADLSRPTWRPGAAKLENAVVGDGSSESTES